jgi:dihydrofolate reductase
MRKLKLQTQVTIDGFVAGPDGDLDWMIWDWDEESKNYVWELNEPVDLILLGRKMSGGFISHWETQANDPETADRFSRKMVDTPKIVFSETLETIEGKNVRLNETGLVEEITALKNADGGDIIAYGGAGFVRSLINNDLIDEYHLFINPVAIGRGMPIFTELEDRLKLKLVDARAFSCGIVDLYYKPQK